MGMMGLSSLRPWNDGEYADWDNGFMNGSGMMGYGSRDDGYGMGPGMYGLRHESRTSGNMPMGMGMMGPYVGSNQPALSLTTRCQG